ncbi:MAG: hypothetical protein ABR500_03885, partial [Dermatophilaceae bacterium]
MPTEDHPSPRRVDDHAALLRITGDDPYVRWGVPDPLSAPALFVPGAVAVERHGRRRGYWVWPLDDARDPTAAVGYAVQALVDGGHLERPEVDSLSIAQPYATVAAGVVDLASGGDWDWMWTTTP